MRCEAGSIRAVSQDNDHSAEIGVSALQTPSILGSQTWLSSLLLSPREVEKLVIYQVAELARRRRQRGTKLNIPESIALICEALLESARDGASLADTIELGRRVLTHDDVLPGVAELVTIVQVEAIFPTGTQLVSVSNPIVSPARPAEGSGAMIPGEWFPADGPVEINAGRPTVRLPVRNTGDRPIQVGSHYHFFEVNKVLDFDRRQALGKRLNVPSGQAIRFEAGEVKDVELVEFGGMGRITGFSRLVEGTVGSPQVTQRALRRATELGYRGLPDRPEVSR